MKHFKLGIMAFSTIFCAWMLTGSALAQSASPTSAQVKAQQDLAAAQAAMDKANKDAATDKAAAEKARITKLLADCTSCGTVSAVTTEKRKGSGGVVGIVGGAVAGAVLGHQIGGGTGKTLATVGGAAAGAAAGNEIQKRLSKKTVHITTIQMKDGSVRKFESESAPGWGVGDAVKLDLNANTVIKL